MRNTSLLELRVIKKKNFVMKNFSLKIKYSFGKNFFWNFNEFALKVNSSRIGVKLPALPVLPLGVEAGNFWGCEGFLPEFS